MSGDVQTIRDLFGLNRKPLAQEKIEEILKAREEDQTLTALMSTLTPEDAADIRSKIDGLRRDVRQDTKNPDDLVLCQWNSLFRVPIIKGQKTRDLHPFVIKRSEIPKYQHKGYLVVLCTYHIVQPKAEAKAETRKVEAPVVEVDKGKKFGVKAKDESPVSESEVDTTTVNL